MTQTRVPDLRHLLSLGMDDEPSAAPARALALTRQHRLPVEATALALGVTGDPGWSAAIAEERALAAVRSATWHVLDRALGPVRSAVAIGGMPWRPPVGTDVDLLVPRRLFAEVRQRLIGAGLVEIGRHAGPGRTGLARIGPDDSVDLVDVETTDDDAFAPTGEGIAPVGAGGFAELRPEAAGERLCRVVAARGAVRLRDLADAEALDLFSLPRPIADPAAHGWELLRDAANGGPLPPPTTARPDSRWRRSAGRAELVLRLPRALLRGRSVRVLCVGPSAGARAAELAVDLRTLAIEVVLLEEPRRGSYLRAVLRGMTGDAVVVAAVDEPSRLFPRPTLLTDPAAGRHELLRQALQLLTA